MRQAEKIPEQSNSISESNDQKVRVAYGGPIRGTEGGLRADMFEHDNPEYDEAPCICDLPDHAQDILYDEIQNDEEILNA
tara:strand:+ start:1907 stop:2146 length:240 start_codon:yes stop_codon:yes gene_type:complete